jgi:hypothetical protein
MAASKAQHWCFLAPFWLAPMEFQPNMVFFCMQSIELQEADGGTTTPYSSARMTLAP